MDYSRPSTPTSRRYRRWRWLRGITERHPRMFPRGLRDRIYIRERVASSDALHEAVRR